MLTEQQKAINKFKTWQEKKFIKNAKQGRYFFRPDRIGTPTPRSYYEAFGRDYHKDDTERNEKIITWILQIFVVCYIGFVILNEIK